MHNGLADMIDEILRQDCNGQNAISKASRALIKVNMVPYLFQ